MPAKQSPVETALRIVFEFCVIPSSPSCPMSAFKKSLPPKRTFLFVFFTYKRVVRMVKAEPDF